MPIPTNSGSHPSAQRSKISFGILISALSIVLSLSGCSSTPTTPPPTATKAPQALDKLSAAQLSKLNKAIKASPKNPELHYQKASILAHKSHWNDSLKSIETAIDLNSREAKYFLLRGVAQRHVGQFELAVKSYKKSLSLDKSTSLAHYNLGIVYDLYLNQPKKAISHFRRYQKLSQSPDPEVNRWLIEISRRAKGTS